MVKNALDYLPIIVNSHTQSIREVPHSRFRKSVRNVYYLLAKNSDLVDKVLPKYLIQDGNLDSHVGFIVNIGNGIEDSYFVTYNKVPISAYSIMNNLGNGLRGIDTNYSTLFLAYLYVLDRFSTKGNAYLFYEDALLQPYLRK